ncbi:MAG: hypothetical protein AB1349_08640 [Elusimicrobiota bacterium]
MNKYISVFLLSFVCMNLFAFEREDFWTEWKNEKAKHWQIMKAISEERSAQKQYSGVGIDIFGQRFRNEEYILQPRFDQMRGIVITYRQETLNYGELLLTFNRDVDLSLYDNIEKIQYRWIGDLVSYWRTDVGAVNPEDVRAYVVEAEGIVSNGTDYIKDINKGGYMDYYLKFTEYKQIVNGVEKIGYTREKGSENLNWTFAGGNYERKSVYVRSFPPDIPDIIEPSGQFQDGHGGIYAGDITTNKYGDGTFQKWETYYAQVKNKENSRVKEVIYTASEFEGRKIDLIVDCDYNSNPMIKGANPINFYQNLPGEASLYLDYPGDSHYPSIKN